MLKMVFRMKTRRVRFDNHRYNIITREIVKFMNFTFRVHEKFDAEIVAS